MISKLKYLVPKLLPGNTNHHLWKILYRKLGKEVSGFVTDKFLELLLKGMKLAFCLFEDYRKNIENFKGNYLFNTTEGGVAASITFDNGNVKVYDDAIKDWDIKITFDNPQSLMEYLFSKDQDILNSLLKNEVEVEGNLNYIYKLGYLARNLILKFNL